jgi:ribosome-binding ATPase YchF (GTP1/OBG family)
LGERVLNEVRSYDCLLGVLDAFSGLNDPHKQWQAIEADMMVSDMAVIEKKLERMVLDKKKNAPSYDAKQETLLQQAMQRLEEETPLREDAELAHAPELRGFAFLSAKPVLYIWNGSESDFADLELPAERPGQKHIAVAAKLERELAEVEDPEERQMFLDDLGIQETALDKVIAKTYDLLGLISFLTAGEKEVRAWPVRNGAKAPEAAGVIHSDFEKGFIRAEVIGYGDFMEHGTFKACKDKGLARLEGKEYVIKDGDIIEFRFNV